MDQTTLYFLILSLSMALIVGALAWRGRARHPTRPSGTLGLLRSSHRKAYLGLLAGGSLLLSMGVFPLMIGLAWIPDMDGWQLTMIGLAFVLGGSQLVWRAQVGRSTRIDCYTDGLVYHKQHTVTMIPWSAIAEIKRHSDLRTYGLILYTVPAGRIDLAGMRDGRTLTDAVMAAVAQHGGAAAWDQVLYGNKGGDLSTAASHWDTDPHQQVNSAERRAPAGLGEQIFNIVGFMLTLALWIAPWIVFWPLRPEHLLAGVIGLALAILASSRHARQWNWQLRRWHDPDRMVTSPDRLAFMMPLAVAAGAMTARYGLVEHMFGKGVSDILFICIANGLSPFLIYLQIHDWRLA